MKVINQFRLLVLSSFILLLLNACSAPAPKNSPRLPPRVEKPIQAPHIPEIKRPKPVKQYHYKRGKKAKPRRYAPMRRVKPKVRLKPPREYKKTKVQRYPGLRPSVKGAVKVAPTKPATTVTKIQPITVIKKPTKKIEPPEDKGLDIDPYANIPENSEDKSRGRSAESSPAVQALLVQAYADAKLGRRDAAMSKLERGLRIEPQNPKLWYQLAELHYAAGDYQQAITMAKKAINFSENDAQMKGKNWDFISKVAKRSGDRRTLSEADDYKKRTR
ncbi:MAG: tetratricopeptide repeat protein [Cocleimonas sp.]|nr:tetratricopeptide repeat protein [Cocleimonas sp.]